MKKIVIAVSVLLCVTAVLATLLVISNQEDLTAKVPAMDVLINGTSHSNKKLKDPLLVYKQMTYVPMSSEMGQVMGFESSFEQGQVAFNSKNPLPTASFTYTEEAHADEVPIQLIEQGFTKDQQKIEGTIKRPLIVYKETVYLPLSWHAITNVFGWEFHWLQGKQLVINTPHFNAEESVQEAMESEDVISAEEVAEAILEEDVPAGEPVKNQEESIAEEVQPMVVKPEVEEATPLEITAESSEENKIAEKESDKEPVINPQPVEEEQVKEPETKPEPESESPEQAAKNIQFKMRYTFDVPGDTDEITFTCVVPKSYNRRQVLKEINYSIEPVRSFEANNTEYATFVIKNPERTVNLDIVSDLTLLKYDYTMAEAFNAVDAPFNNVHLKPEANIESSHQKIIDALALDGKSTDEKIKRIHAFVLDRMSYEDVDSDEGALFALTNREGDCQEYADLFIALCRAEGVPARIAEGFTTVGTANGHEWVEAYHEDYGWIPFDLTFADSQYAGSDYTFNRLDNVYIYLTHLRNDPQFEYVQNGEKKYGHYWECSFKGDRIGVERTVEFINK